MIWHVLRRFPIAVVRRREIINVSDTMRDQGRPENTLIETINKDLNTLNLTKYITLYKS